MPLARELRIRPEFSHIPHRGRHSYAMVGGREKTIAAGCSGYIEKADHPDTFIRKLKNSCPDLSGVGET
jgi:two-component system cell cycle response regulator DivK